MAHEIFKLAPISGKPKPMNYFGVNFYIMPSSQCEEAWNAKRLKVQQSVDFDSLSNQDKARLNGKALTEVISGHDSFKLPGSDDVIEYGDKSPDPDFESFVEGLLYHEDEFRIRVLNFFLNTSNFEDLERAEVIKKS